MNLIKQLRQRTSAPIKDVKASLLACNWDIEAAQKDLRKRGVALAAKKSLRTAAEGLLAIAQDDKRAAVVELNCETDFVARNDVFQYLASSLAKMALSAQGPGELFMPFCPEFLENMSINLDHPMLSGETTVQNAVTEVAAMVGENVKLRRGFMLSTTAHDVMGMICSRFSLVKQIPKYNRNTYIHTILFRPYLPCFNSDLTRSSCVRFVFASSIC
jgi:translation elongation factor EF-Ts